jgi:type IV pilus assembly protein PilB
LLAGRTVEPPLGELLVRSERLTPDGLTLAERHRAMHGGGLGPCLVRLGLVADADIARELSAYYGVPAIDLARFELDPAIVALVPSDLARTRRVIPIARHETTLTLAMADPADVSAIDEVRFVTGCFVEPVVAAETALLESLQAYGLDSAPLDRVTRAISVDRGANASISPERIGIPIVPSRAESAEDAPIITLARELVRAAVRRGASDIHLEPGEEDFRVRFRVDGVLHVVMTPPVHVRDALVARFKILARLDIAEKRLPQDGRLKAHVDDSRSARLVDVRVSSLPTLHGEKLVLRLLDRDHLRLDLDALGFEADARARFEAAIGRPWGMVLVTGPTGSGKTNTLYSAIARLTTPRVNVLTVEDPVEINLPGITQVQVHESIGLTFAAALRAFLRQDPDVLLVGEIRDAETAQMAIRAALTGHLVLATLHTTDAPGALIRLLNMGVEPFLVAGAVNLVCAQRLVRRVCAACRESHPGAEQLLEDLGVPRADAAAIRPVRSVGCARCHHTGYRGRIGLFEVMTLTDSLRQLVLDGAPGYRLRAQAIADGMRPLRASGLAKIEAGVTTIDEVLRETTADDPRTIDERRR